MLAMTRYGYTEGNQNSLLTKEKTHHDGHGMNNAENNVTDNE